MQHPSSDNDQEIEMCCPMPLVKSPQATLFTAHSSRIPERTAFASPSRIKSPEVHQQQQQHQHQHHPQRQAEYCNFQSSPYDRSLAISGLTPAPRNMKLQCSQPNPPVAMEPSKVYRKSPFLPRKKDSPEISSAPKKESKLSTLGSSLLKNLTTSPFSQRKHPMPLPVQSELPQPVHIDHQIHHQQPHHFQQRAVAEGQLTRQIFQNSPLLQRRNPSYVTYGECNGPPPPPSSKGVGSANTSPIGKWKYHYNSGFVITVSLYFTCM